ncbi:MAG: UDP-N-acetylmuramoyl-tripeptide--D-alanyl-D-alanine ligase [Proteobacteria bacterium]|nr:UDP-N-acetylmuramoyl-tripeptide--D-alanyl-D-alanine ligase [Pseudomonadota bacterium]
MRLEQVLSLQETAEAVRGSLHGRGDLPVPGISTDSRSVVPGELFVALRGPKFDGHEYIPDALARGAAAVLSEKELPEKSAPAAVVVPDTLRALGDLARHYRDKFPVPLVAITGSNGKTSTKEILTAILRKAWGEDRVLGSSGNFNNQVGVPLTLFTLRKNHRAAVLEFGTNQEGEIARLGKIAAPTVGVITNVGSSHLAGLGGIEGVAREKESLLFSLPTGIGRAVLNADDPRVLAMASRYRERGGEAVLFGLSPEAAVRADGIRPRDWGLEFEVKFPNCGLPAKLNFPGVSGVRNVLAAGAAAFTLGLSPEEIVSAWEGFKPFPGRLAPVLSGRGYWVIDDTYNANPNSTAEALQVLSERLALAGARSGRGQTWAILGEMLELGDETREAHFRVGEQAARLGIDCLVLLDSPDGAIRALSEGARAAGMAGEKIRVFPDHGRLIEGIRRLIAPEDLVLVKGSRATRMDQVVKTLVENHDL